MPLASLSPTPFTPEEAESARTQGRSRASCTPGLGAGGTSPRARAVPDLGTATGEVCVSAVSENVTELDTLHDAVICVMCDAICAIQPILRAIPDSEGGADGSTALLPAAAASELPWPLLPPSITLPPTLPPVRSPLSPPSPLLPPLPLPKGLLAALAAASAAEGLVEGLADTDDL